jgi:Undecaprenyl-phosphate glucose phosphotransferase
MAPSACRPAQIMNLSVSGLKSEASASNFRRPERPVSDHLYGRIEAVLVRTVVIEFLVVAGTCFLTSVIYFKTILTQWPPAAEYVPTALVIAILVLLTTLGFRQHRAIQAQPRDRYLWSGIGAVTLAFSLFLSLLFVFKIADWYSRGTFLSQFFGVAAAVLMSRGAMHRYVRHAIQVGTIEARRAVLVGDAGANGDVLRRLQQFGVRYAGVLPFPSVPGKISSGVQTFSTAIQTFVEQCRRLRPDDVIFLGTPEDLPRIVDALSQLPVTAHVIPTGVSDLWSSAKIVNFGEAVTIQVLRPPLSNFDLALKRAFDVCLAGIGLLVLSPLLLTVALAVKLDSDGPILFRQNRHGYNNDVIPVIKFRTMAVMEDGETARTFTQARANDDRVTRLGRLLRRTNIDELPQLLNIVRGEMSVVGPRPHPIALNAMFHERIAPFSRRHNVKPGLTGWAQVNGFRGETDTLEKMQRRIEYDLQYIDNWSFLFDLKILLMTLFSKGAYRNAA